MQQSTDKLKILLFNLCSSTEYWGWDGVIMTGVHHILGIVFHITVIPSFRNNCSYIICVEEAAKGQTN